MKKLHPVILSIASGIILWLSWPMSPLTAFIFFAFVPLLLVADTVPKRSKFVGHSFLAMLLWNIGATWWIWNSTDIGSVAAMIANSLLMCLPWWGYHVFKEQYGRSIGYLSLISCWMCFEFIHLNWQLSWPWLNLGNVFAVQTNWVQWYEYTGIGGGTLWILLVNVLVYHWLFIEKTHVQQSKNKQALVVAAVLLLPVGVSYLHFAHNSKAADNVVIVQPNIDPYGKFNPGSVSDQIQLHVRLSENAIDGHTKLIIWPETALSANSEINSMAQVQEYSPVFALLQRHPDITLLSGIETYRLYGTEKPASPYARKLSDGTYYDSYNAAVSIKSGEPLQFYIKSKLVPGVETLPTFLNFFGPIFEKFGGTTGGYAKDTASVVFSNKDNPYVTAPIICYESIYGEYVASYVKKGANILTIMTNDGWWGNTPGHKQHLNYARLRAIETRRWVARSANTGISAVIDDHGNILKTQPWNKASIIKYPIPTGRTETFYVKTGDYLYRLFSVLAGLLVLWNLIAFIRKKIRI